MDNSSKRSHNLCRATQIHIHQHLPDSFMHNSCGREIPNTTASLTGMDLKKKGTITLHPLTGPWKCHLPPLYFSSYDPTGFMSGTSLITFSCPPKWVTFITALNAGEISPYQHTDQSDFPLSAMNNSSLRSKYSYFGRKRENSIILGICQYINMSSCSTASMNSLHCFNKQFICQHGLRNILRQRSISVFCFDATKKGGEKIRQSYRFVQACISVELQRYHQ